MDEFLNIIKGTPIWVWIALCYLLFVGIKATRRRCVYLPKLFIVPSILIVLKYKVFILGGWMSWIVYLLSLGLGSFVGFKMASKEVVRVLKQAKQVEIPGAYQTLIVLIFFFCIKYVFGYLESQYLDVWRRTLILNMGLSGLVSGFLIGKALNYWRRLKLKNL